ncbi:VC0807 family protein [Paenibacillus sp. S-38]|uniref:VC0807 family protein n=1 Tax=Paenibacillus sp. S-38 TaxID=3416710 RepID=UPI003CEF2EBD
MSKRTYLLVTLILNGLLPWGLYVWLSAHMSSMAALSIATLVPLADNAVQLIRHRRLDAFGSLMLFTLLLSLALVWMGGSEKILLVRESLITAGVGLFFLGSLLFPRPLIYYLAVRFAPNSPFPENWQYAYFRGVMKRMTLVWGLILMSEAAVRILMVNELSIETYLALSHLVLYGFIGSAVVWTMLYRRRCAAKLAMIKQSSC